MNCTEFMNRIADNQRRIIESIISNEYYKMGVNVLGKGTEVEVKYQTRIIITINSEDPFISTDFFTLVDNVRKRTAEAMKIYGFKHIKSEMFYGYWICTFNFVGDNVI